MALTKEQILTPFLSFWLPPCCIIVCDAFALFAPTSSATLGIAFKASLMLCSHLHEQSGRTRMRPFIIMF